MSLNLIELAKSVPGLTVNVSLTDLLAFHKETLADAKKELEEFVISEKTETLKSPKQACEELDVDLTTLWRWAKKGYLVPIEIGGKRRYRSSDINAIKNGGKGKAK